MTRCLKQLIQQKVKMILISSTPYRLVIVLLLLFLWPPCAADANIIFSQRAQNVKVTLNNV